MIYVKVSTDKNLPILQYVINNNLQSKYDQHIYGMHIQLHFSTIWVPFIC